MKKILIYIVAIPAFLVPSSYTNKKFTSVTQNITTPIKNYINSKPLFKSTKNFYVDPKYDRIHASMYGYKSIHYNPLVDLYINPIYNYWDQQTHDVYTRNYHKFSKWLEMNKKNIDPETGNAIKQYNQAYQDYQQKRDLENNEEELVTKQNLLKQIKQLDDAITKKKLSDLPHEYTKSLYTK